MLYSYHTTHQDFIVLSDAELSIQLIHNYVVDCYVIQPGTSRDCDPTAPVQLVYLQATPQTACDSTV